MIRGTVRSSLTTGKKRQPRASSEWGTKTKGFEMKKLCIFHKWVSTIERGVGNFLVAGVKCSRCGKEKYPKVQMSTDKDILGEDALKKLQAA